MQLREGTIAAAGTWTVCGGCTTRIDCAQRHITLQLDNLDHTLNNKDLVFAYFHTEHCLARMLRRAYNLPIQ